MKATLHTNHGPIVVELFSNEAPKTVANFTGLATGSKQYKDDAGYAFDDEIHPDKQFDRPYLFAMANAGKRMGKGTNGSQFFITVGATPWLNGKHTIFGEVADGPSREVVDKLAAVPTGQMDKPIDDVVIERVEIED